MANRLARDLSLQPPHRLACGSASGGSQGLPGHRRIVDEFKYPHQRMFVVEVDDYAWLVPYVENDNEIFLKSIIPSRKDTKHYLRGRYEKLNPEDQEMLEAFEEANFNLIYKTSAKLSLPNWRRKQFKKISASISAFRAETWKHCNMEQ